MLMASAAAVAVVLIGFFVIRGTSPHRRSSWLPSNQRLDEL
jgi:hypothetical protein